MLEKGRAVISKKYKGLVFSFFMSLLMSCIMSLVVCYLNIGLVESFIWTWFKSWGISFMIAYPTIFVISPLVNWLVGSVIEAEEPTS